MEIKIEKGIPIVENRGAKRKYHFSGLNVGDSFFTLAPSHSTLNNSCAVFIKNHQPTWKLKVVRENEGFRVHRIK